MSGTLSRLVRLPKSIDTGLPSTATRTLAALTPLVAPAALPNWNVTLGTNATFTEIASVGRPKQRALRLTTDALASANAQGYTNTTFNLSDPAHVWVQVRCAVPGTNSLALYTSDAPAYAEIKGRLIASTFEIGSLGRQAIPILKSEWATATGAPDIADDQKTLRLVVFSTPSFTRQIEFEGLFIGKPQAAVLFCFDDGEPSQVKAWPISDRFRVPVAYFLIASFIGVGAYPTLPQWLARRDLGDTLGLHGAVPWGPDMSRAASDLAAQRALGINSKYAAWPEGNIGTPWDVNAAYLRNLGISAGRGAGNPLILPGITECMFFGCKSLDSALSLAAAKALVDRAVAVGATVTFMGHKLNDVSAGVLTWKTQDYSDLVEYCALKRSQGVLATPTWEDWLGDGW